MLESREKFRLVDVRAKEDFAREHIKGAESLPLDEIDKRARYLFEPEETIVTYCDSFICSASSSGAKMLSNLGLKNVRDYKGGLREWKQAGNQTESSM